MKSFKYTKHVTAFLCFCAVAGINVYLFGSEYSEETPESYSVPVNYQLESTSRKDDEIIHTFVKAKPERAVISHTSKESFERYEQSLDTELERITANDFKSLTTSYQNAMLYANTTALIRTAKENINAIEKLNNEDSPPSKQETEIVPAHDIGIDGNGISVTDSVTGQTDLLADIKLKGVISNSSGKYALLHLGDGSSVFGYEGMKLEGDIVVSQISEQYVHISHKDKTRKIPIL